MYPVSWQLRELAAELQCGGLVAEIAPLRPSDGMVNVVVAGHRLAAARLLGIAVGPSVESQSTALIERYVRGADLVVAYEESGQWPVRVDAVWRVAAAAAADKFVAGIDLIVSVRTHLLDACANLAVQSVVPLSDVFRLPSPHCAACEPLALVAGAPTIIDPERGGGCLLFRLPGVDLTYVEMLHPVDFQHDELSRGEPGGGTLRIVHRLFRTSLEKGVILRARVRGVFVKRQGDAEAAAECYASLAAADPPLST